MPLTIEEAKEAQAKYRSQQKAEFRKKIDCLLSKGFRSIISPNGAMFGEDIEAVMAEYKAIGWHLKLTHDFFTEIHFSETPFESKKPKPRSIIDSIVGFFR